MSIVRRFVYLRHTDKSISALAVAAVLLGCMLLPGLPSVAQAHHLPTSSVSEAVTGLGAPDHLSYGVADARRVARQFAAATGTQFGPVQTSTETVMFPERGTSEKVTLTRTFSVRNGPFIEFVEASRKIGPWASDSNRSTIALSYSVDDVWESALPLVNAGMQLIASSGQRFTYWRGIGGIVVRLVDRSLVPSTGGVNKPQALIDLGVPPLVAFSPCDPLAVKSQMSAALGFGWRQTGVFVLPFELRDGSVHDGVELTAEFSVPEQPFILLETSKPSIEPFACPNTHLAFQVADIRVVDRQIKAAGMNWIARGAGGLVVYYRGLGGVDIEIFHPSLGGPPPA